ncbi:hypothetical protein EZV62_015207 [Acer yangbiense]|uniref:STAS domain-containing protein n=1 Tax=Acer yangbiense TaxID=1000413 RepID=A0A5C7HV19_9ROSI|nr:hypothetical protein EZV62_015207 [Acer yangbiense]
MASSAIGSSNVQERLDVEQNNLNERARWVLDAPEPPGVWHELLDCAKENILPPGNKFLSLRNEPGTKRSIGYATLAKLDPQYGLYTSVVPPLIYAIMGTSREIAIGPVAVVSLLLLGFLVDFLSHASIVGFMAGAAIVIGLQQLKGLLGITHFTNKTDIVSVLKAVLKSVHHPWNPHNFILGCSFLSFILITRFLGRRNKKLFWLPAIAPLISVSLSTLIVFLTRADKHGVKIVKHINGGLNPISVHELQFHGQDVGELARIGLILAVVALTVRIEFDRVVDEAIAVGRSIASIKGYHLDGNKEMVAMGFMNIVGSFTSCYVATGSFSRSAVNFSAGCESTVSNIVMAITVVMSLELFTRLLYYTPIAILASIILSALPGLIDLHEVQNIWKIDKLDFLACIGAFFGVVFASVEIGLLAAVTISFAKIIILSIRPGVESLGRLPGTDLFCHVNQYPVAVKTPGILIFRIKSALLCFANANFVRERIMRWVVEENNHAESEERAQRTTRVVVLDLSSLMNIDTSGIASLEELHKILDSNGMQLAIASPRWKVIDKLRLAKFVDKIGGRVFLTVGEAMDACLNPKMATI